VGNMWFYHAAYVNNYHTNDLYKVVKVVTGMTPDGYAVVTTRSYYYSSGNVTTSTEYWKNVGNTFYMDSTSPSWDWQPVYDGMGIDSVHSLYTIGGLGWPITWSPSSVNLFGQAWVGRSRRDSDEFRYKAGLYYGQTRSVASGLGPYYQNSFRTDGFGDFFDTRLTLRAALLDGVLLGDSSYALSIFPRLLACPGVTSTVLGPVEIRNTGAAQINVVSVQSSDPAFAADRQQISIPAGGVGSLSIVFTPRGPGLTRCTITVFTDQGISDEFHVIAEGQAIQVVQPYSNVVADRNAIDFGQVPVGSSRTDSIFFVNAGNEVEIQDGASIPPLGFTIVSNPQNQMSPRESTKVVIQFAPPVGGTYAGSYISNWTGAFRLDTVYLRGVGVGAPMLSLPPGQRCDFGAVLLTFPRDTAIAMANRGTDTLKITSVSVSDDQFLVLAYTASIAPGGQGSALLRFVPERLASVNAILTIRSNSAKASDTLKLSASGRATISIRTIDGSPQAFGMEQNFPNPFNPATVFRFALPEPSDARLSVYSMLGQKVAEVFHLQLPAGSYESEWNATGIASGAYVYRLQAGQHVSAKKLVIVR